MRSIVSATRWTALAAAMAAGQGSCHPADRANPDPVQASPGDHGAVVPPVRWNGGDTYTYRVELGSSSQNMASSTVVAFRATAALRVRPQQAAGATEFSRSCSTSA